MRAGTFSTGWALDRQFQTRAPREFSPRPIASFAPAVRPRSIRPRRSHERPATLLRRWSAGPRRQRRWAGQWPHPSPPLQEGGRRRARHHMTADELAARRQALGLSQSELARMLGVPRLTIWKWEHARQKVPALMEMALRG